MSLPAALLRLLIPAARNSSAFREAVLRVEVRRAYAVISVLALSSVLIFVRELNSDIDDRLPLLGLMSVGLLLCVQLVVLAAVRWAHRGDRLIPGWFVVGTVVVENLIPGVLMATTLLTGMVPPYALLSSPPLLAYGMLFVLTTLRLRPALCLLAGAIASCSYIALLLYVRHGLGLKPPPGGLPAAAFVSFPTLLFLSAIATAWVASELRKLFDAALTEVEARRVLDRMEQDMAVASSIQRALLPGEPPVIDGFEVAGWNRPADQTGGDYFDWQALPDGRWLITLADVSGHGIGPALVTTACRAYARASSQFEGGGGDLPRLLTRVNALLAHDLPDGRFVTMASVVVTPGQAEVGVLSAGHGPLLLWAHRAGAVEDLKPADLPLAIVPDLEFGPARVVRMHEGDVLALITDGFFEWSRPAAPGSAEAREQYGLDRLRESLKRHADKPAAQIVTALADDVARFAGVTSQQDDLTVVVIKRVGDAARS